MQIYLPIAEMSVNIFLILGMGGAVGFLSGMFGVGGGFLMTPLLIFTGLPPPVAVATEANQIVASSASGAMAHWRRARAVLNATTLGLLESARGGIGESLQKAYDAAQKGHVTRRQRLLIEAFHGDWTFRQIGNRKVLEQLVDLYPEDIEGNGYLAQNYYQNEEYEKALACLNVLIRNNTATTLNYLRMGEIYFYTHLLCYFSKASFAMGFKFNPLPQVSRTFSR